MANTNHNGMGLLQAGQRPRSAVRRRLLQQPRGASRAERRRQRDRPRLGTILVAVAGVTSGLLAVAAWCFHRSGAGQLVHSQGGLG